MQISWEERKTKVRDKSKKNPNADIPFYCFTSKGKVSDIG